MIIINTLFFLLEIIDEVRKLRNRYGGFPGDQDLHGAAKALKRLQKMYQLNVSDFTHGNIMGFQTAAELDLKDTFYLGRFAAMQDSPDVALKWLQHAALEAAANSQNNNNNNNILQNKTLIKTTQVEGVLKQVQRKMERSGTTLDDNDDQDPYILYQIPPRSNDPKQMVSDNDRRNFQVLCRGETLYPRRRRQVEMFLFEAASAIYSFAD